MDGYGLISTERLEQITHNQNRIECLSARLSDAKSDIADRYTKSEVDAKLECITDTSELEDHLRDPHAHQELFDQKVDKREGYSLMSDDEIAQVTTNKDDITALDNRVTTNEINISKTYTQSEVDTLLTNKANAIIPSSFTLPFVSGIEPIHSVFWKNEFGEVSIIFAIKKPSGFVSDIVATLPQGYRPQSLSSRFVWVINTTALVGNLATCYIYPNGDIRVTNNVSGANEAYFWATFLSNI